MSGVRVTPAATKMVMGDMDAEYRPGSLSCVSAVPDDRLVVTLYSGVMGDDGKVAREATVMDLDREGVRFILEAARYWGLIND